MYCPRCGQQQLSNQTKFCSRCGFPLGLVSEMLEHNGTLPQLADLYTGKAGIFTKRNGVLFGVIWFILFVMMFPALFAILGGEEIVGISAAFGVFSSLIIVIASLAFLKRTPKKPRDLANLTTAVPLSAHLGGTESMPALGASTAVPATEYAPPHGKWRTPETGELATPPSITENTTKILKKENE